MKQRLQHARLEKVIHNNQALNELLALPCQVLGNYCVRDYIGSPALKQDPTTDNRYAKGFFEDQGAWRQTLTLAADSGLSLAIFATFLVVEIEAGTEQAEFLVLTPKRTRQQEGGMYVGLMKSHNTDALCQSLADNPALTVQIAAEVMALLDELRGPASEQVVKPLAKQAGQSAKPATVSESWFGRLFGANHK